VLSDLAEWVECVFGQADPSNYTEANRFDGICGPDEVTVLRLIEVFENPATILKPYAVDILDQAFWDLGGEAFRVVYKKAVPWAVRLRFIRSFETLFRELFAVRCAPILSHSSKEGRALNTACYMWWDFDCWVAMPDPLTRNPIDSAFLASMRSILAIDHVACQESALHGLGHWHRAHSAAVEAIIDEFVKNKRHLPERLSEYASAARCGCVL
jgi:hypothetical protein